MLDPDPMLEERGGSIPRNVALVPLSLFFLPSPPFLACILPRPSPSPWLQHCDLTPLSEQDIKRRAALVVHNAASMGCASFVRPRDIVSGNKDLNLAFTAVLFNEFPALSMDDVPQVGCLDARVRSMLSCVGAGMRAC